MPAEILLSAKLHTAGNRSSQATKADDDLPSSPQRLLAGSTGIMSPTVAHGLHVVVEATEHCIDHGLYLVAPSTAASSPQAEKIPWIAPYTVAQFSNSEKIPWIVHTSRPSSGYFISKRQVRKCLIISMATVLAIVITLGVALGVGLTASGNIIKGLPSSFTIPTDRPTAMYCLLFNDTSIAAFETEDRHRHMFYQTTNGSIQYALYSTKWSFQDLGLNNARSHTPLSAVPGNNGTIYLFYITNNNVLTSTRMTAGSWIPYPMSIPLEISTQTRQLDASVVPSYGGDVFDFQLFVLTQCPGDSVSLIHLSTNSTQSSFKQMDITAFLNGSGSTGGRSLNSPCAVSANVSNVSISYAPFLSSHVIYPWVGIFSGGSGNPANGIAGAGYDGKQLSYYEFGSINDESKYASSAALSTSVASTSYDLDVAVIHGQLSILYVEKGILISSGQMSPYPGSVKNDSSVYPFARLGGFLSANGLYYMYHQLDESTIAEAVFDPMADWTTSNVTIGT